MKKNIAFAILSILIALGGHAYGAVFSQTHNDPSGVQFTTTVDTDQRSVLYEYDFSALAYSYEQIKIGQPGFPTSAIDRTASRDPESPFATAYNYFEGETRFQVEYKTGQDPPAVNWIKLHYVAGYNFAGFNSPNDNFQVTYRKPPGGFPIGQEDNIFVGAHTPIVISSGQNQAPVANDNAYDTNEESALSIAAPGVLGNDTDADGDPLTAILNVDPPNGILTLSADGSFTYTPDANFTGLDTFSYHANDGVVDSNIATVRITVSPLNDSPVANAGANQAVFVGDTVFLDGSGSSDVEGDPLTFSWSFVSKPAGSTAALSDSTAEMPTFVADLRGTYVVQLIVNDGLADSVADTVNISMANAALPAINSLLLD